MHEQMFMGAQMVIGFWLMAGAVAVLMFLNYLEEGWREEDFTILKRRQDSMVDEIMRDYARKQQLEGLSRQTLDTILDLEHRLLLKITPPQPITAITGDPFPPMKERLKRGKRHGKKK
jgi:hypothetical protein